MRVKWTHWAGSRQRPNTLPRVQIGALLQYMFPLSAIKLPEPFMTLSINDPKFISRRYFCGGYGVPTVILLSNPVIFHIFSLLHIPLCNCFIDPKLIKIQEAVIFTYGYQ